MLLKQDFLNVDLKYGIMGKFLKPRSWMCNLNRKAIPYQGSVNNIRTLRVFEMFIIQVNWQLALDL